MWIRMRSDPHSFRSVYPDPGVENEEINKSLTSIFFLFHRNRNRKNALPIIQEIKFIIIKSELNKEDIIADTRLMQANY